MPASKNVTGVHGHKQHHETSPVDLSKPQKLDDETKRKVIWVAAAVFGALAICGAVALFAPSLLGITVVLMNLSVVIPTGCATSVAGIATASCLYLLAKTRPFVSITLNDPCKLFDNVGGMAPVTDKGLKEEMGKDFKRGDPKHLIHITVGEKAPRPALDWVEKVEEEERGEYMSEVVLPELLISEERKKLIPRISQALVQRGPRAIRQHFVAPRLETLHGLPSESITRYGCFGEYDKPTRELVIPKDPNGKVQVKINYQITQFYAADPITGMIIKDPDGNCGFDVKYTVEAVITFDPRGPEFDTITMVLRKGLHGIAPTREDEAAATAAAAKYDETNTSKDVDTVD